MMSVFSLAVESADDPVVTSKHMVLSSDAGMMETANDLHREMCNEGTQLDELHEGDSQMLELQATVEIAVESAPLSMHSLQYLRVALRNIVGRSYASKRLPAMETAERHSPHAVTRIAMEGIGETIKQFWEAIKSQLAKFWNSTKSWYIKTFDIANKIIARAKVLEEKTNTMTSSPTEKSFEMGGLSLISTNYQTKEPNDCIKGLIALKTVLDTVLVNITKQNGTDKSDKVLNACQKVVQLVRSTTAQTTASLPQIYTDSQFASALDGVFDGSFPKYDDIAKAPATVDTEMVKKLGIDPALATYAQSAPLPGNRSLFVIAPITFNVTIAPTSFSDLNTSLLEPLKLFRWMLADTGSKPKEIEDSADIKTLLSGQVSLIAQTCEEMGTTILSYKKEFEARDKYISRLVKGFDVIMKDLENDSIDHSAAGAGTEEQQRIAMTTNTAGDATGKTGTAVRDATVPTSSFKSSTAIPEIDKTLRRLSQVFLGLFKKNMTIAGAVVNHSTRVCGAFLVYGERSAAQYTT